MRTTIELSDPIYRRLRAAAVERGTRGFSAIVEDALARYLETADQRRERTLAVEAAEGAWSDEDVRELDEALTRAWSGWRLDRS